MSVGVALIGGGIWAREEHLPAILAAPDLTLKAVCSRTTKSAEALNTFLDAPVPVYSEESGEGFDVLLQRADVHAVIISLPIKSQEPLIRKALQANKHVLSEKPVGENLQDALNLIKWYRSEIAGKGPTWCVAENFRYLASYDHARKELASLGRVVSFYGKILSLQKKEGKWYNTEWRKNPTHQGGFLLDGGVHDMAAIRLLLEAQPGNEVSEVSAFTSQIQEHLPPVDTVHTIWKTKSGVLGSLQMSQGSSLSANEWTVECEKGWVKVDRAGVTVSRDGQTSTTKIENERTGVPPEVRAWGAALAAGKVNKEQEPEAALADLELLELMLKSGEKNGETLKCAYQHVKIGDAQ